MTLIDHSPEFDAATATRIAQQLFGVEAEATVLPSERDQNFLLATHTGGRSVLKIANGQENRSFLEAQNQLMQRVGEGAKVCGMASLCPEVLLSSSGKFIEEAASEAGQNHFVRLLSFLEGTPLAKVKWRSAPLLRDIGRRLGQLDRALEGFDHISLHREFHWDLQQVDNIVETHLSEVAEPELREQIERIQQQFGRFTKRLLPNLRRGAIHNDANDGNVIIGSGPDLYSRHQQVVGFIDLGDMVHSYVVGDLAIAIAYAILEQPQPLAAAAEVIAGYHAEYPLTEDELAVLFGLINMRLCVSACLAAHQQRQRPDDPYLSVSQQPIRNTLPVLVDIPWKLAEGQFRVACRLPALPSCQVVSNWLAGDRTFSRVVEPPLTDRSCIALDLSFESDLVHVEPESIDTVTERIEKKIARNGGSVGLGRYLEPRPIYTADFFRTAGDELRTIHLGIDLFLPAGTPVFAPLAGIVEALSENARPQDYGPVIILRHATDDGTPFFTLYGHLSRESLENLRTGQSISAGESLASLGTREQNGGWPPHLHFQVMSDSLDLRCDFPGVGHYSEINLWRQFCPDPNLILGIPATVFGQKPPPKESTLATRKRRIGSNLSTAYRNPIKVVRGWRQYLFDDVGRKYLDAYNNVPHVGHCHPRVAEAAHRQMRRLNTNTRYLHDSLNEFAERLTATMPASLEVCFFVNSASEANELALRMARAHTRRQDMIVLEGAYHGHTTTLVNMSPYKHDGPGGKGAPRWVHAAPVADVYRGQYKADDRDAAAKYANAVREIIRQIETSGGGIAGFIAESCPSVGGQIIFPNGYLERVYAYVRAAGGVCIADDVQTGYGRLGTHFYGFEMQGVEPDVVVLGKPIGNGHPLAAVVTTKTIADSFDNGMEFFSTFGGNTVSCAVGIAVLDVVHDEGLQKHALDVGEFLLDGLRELASKHPVIGDVRGSGLFLGAELVRNQETLEPASDEASFVCNRMREHGVLLGTDGPFDNVLKIRPPMSFSKDNAATLIDRLQTVLSQELSLAERQMGT